MALIIKDISVVPPEQWSYFVEATGFTVKTNNYQMLYLEVVKHCQSNSVPIPSQQDVITWMCENLTIPCYEGMTPLINKFSLGLPRPPRTGSCC